MEVKTVKARKVVYILMWNNVRVLFREAFILKKIKV